MVGRQLRPSQLYDAVGNHFEPDALNIRWGSCIREWLANPVDAGTRPKTPTQRTLIFEEVRRVSMTWAFNRLSLTRFPKDVRPRLMAAEDSARRASTATASTALLPGAAENSARRASAAVGPTDPPPDAAEHGRNVV